MTDAYGLFLGLAAIGSAILVLWAIVRFSILSPRGTVGARTRLREPEAAVVAELCGFPIPPLLLRFYQTFPHVSRQEFELIDPSTTPTTRWPVGEFLPLTAAVVREWRVISRVPGIPIATDLDKGVYFVTAAGAVVLSSPNVAGGEVIVATTVDTFQTYEAHELHEA